MAASEDGNPEVGEPSPSDLTALLRVGKTGCDVHLTQTHLRWDKPDRKDKTVFGHSVAIADILAIKDVPPTETDKTAQDFCVHHVVKYKNHVWKVTSTSFQAQDEIVCKTWTDGLKQRLATTVLENKRPQIVMVLLNPASGNSQGVQIYEKYGSPLFELAGVKTNVTVTERQHQMTEILQECDLSGVDGIAVVGGDGSLTEVVNGVFKRYMKSAGKDVNNDEEELETCPIRIGIIPAGTGNAMAKGATGTYDVATAVLNIIMGNSVPMEVMSVYNDGKLMSYSALLIGFGFISEVGDYAESNRQMGKMRYVKAMQKGITTFMKFYDFDIHYLPADDFKADPNDEPVGSDGWYNAAGPFVLLFMRSLDLTTAEPLNGTNWIHLNNKLTRKGLTEIMIALQETSPNAYDHDFIKKIKAKMFKIVNVPSRPESGASAGTRSSDVGQTWTINIDGEAHKITSPEVLVKFPTATYRLFGTGPGIKELHKKLQQQRLNSGKT